MDTRLRAAELRRYRAMGWPLFPLRPREKIPATAHGFKDATADRDAWGRWFAVGNAGIGLPTGTTSGVGVVDVDPRNGGDESLDRLQSAHGPLPNTACSLTGGGGRHLLFRVRAPLKTWKLAPGVDVKLDGGYVVLPPSIHPSGSSYRWAPGCEPDVAGLAPLPAWCTRRPRAAPPATREQRAVAKPETAGERYFVAVAGRVRDILMQSPEGGRNNCLNTGAFALGQLAHLTSVNIEWALSVLRAAATVCGLDPREIEPTLRSGFEAGMAKPRQIVFVARERRARGG
jgi:hypothetical protein